MRIVQIEKPYSWLEYPVTLKGLPAAHNPHITVKFFGAAKVDPKYIERACEDLKPYIPWKATDFRWETKIWNASPARMPDYVLLLTRYPSELHTLRRSFELIRDDHSPYQPHITVPKAFFFTVEDQAFEPEDCELTIGEVTLFVGKI